VLDDNREASKVKGGNVLTPLPPLISQSWIVRRVSALPQAPCALASTFSTRLDARLISFFGSEIQGVTWS
jgi:hypothetical protein